jgi:hypothetical protein
MGKMFTWVYCRGNICSGSEVYFTRNILHAKYDKLSKATNFTEMARKTSLGAFTFSPSDESVKYGTIAYLYSYSCFFFFFFLCCFFFTI